MWLAPAQPAIKRAQSKRTCNEGRSTCQSRVQLVVHRLGSHDLGNAAGHAAGHAEGKTHGRRLVGRVGLLIVRKVTDVLWAYGPELGHGLREFMHERLPFVV